MKGRDLLAILKSFCVLFISTAIKRKYSRVCVLAPLHVGSYANAILSVIERNEIDCFLANKVSNEERDVLYVVLCPQSFRSLPAARICIQMEQYSAVQFFKLKHILDLKASLAVFDYSKKNISVLSEAFDFYSKVKWIPVAAKFTGKQIDKEYDFAFYGLMNDRRRKILDRISEKYTVNMISGLYGEQLFSEIRKCNFTLNIHYHEAAIFESPRVTESVACGTPVISEPSHDQECYPWLSGLVYFTDMLTDEMDTFMVMNAIEGAGGACGASARGLVELESALLPIVKGFIGKKSLRSGPKCHV